MVVMAEDAIVAGATAGAGSWGGKSIKVRVRVRVRVVSSVLSSWRAFHCRERDREREKERENGDIAIVDTLQRNRDLFSMPFHLTNHQFELQKWRPQVVLVVDQTLGLAPSQEVIVSEERVRRAKEEIGRGR